LLIALTLAIALPAAAQTYPGKPIKIIVPFTPGGSNDVLARVIAEKLGTAWGQPVVVENKPGAAGHIGAEAAAKSPPDGYTLFVAPNDILTIAPALYSKLPYDPIKDYAPVAMLGALPIVLVVNSNSPIKSVKELIAAAKAKPDSLSYASSGGGTPQHVSAEMFKLMTGAPMLHVPYKGTGPAMTDLLGGQVQVLFSPINSAIPHIKSGKLRALAVASEKRVSYLPEVPTMQEAGVPGYKNDIWIALLAPAGTPKDVVDKLNREVNVILRMPDVKEKLNAQGIEPVTMTAAELGALIASDTPRWAKIIKDTGVKID
jgi:tripartite-type tricarboxylate transporter receptor subunit TctC